MISSSPASSNSPLTLHKRLCYSAKMGKTLRRYGKFQKKFAVRFFITNYRIKIGRHPLRVPAYFGTGNRT